ncbi:VanZ family protein [Noviherbaspirillum sp. UKPF54]|uniref:VanZ family protein n=1 Tax=Noviherbaspirillum sp. UKPF54 TaxID=2601898 RepID=UPI001FEF8891|nr:VanZ family protein [Noviherbaspirillum sp. UKPF54]
MRLFFARLMADPHNRTLAMRAAFLFYAAVIVFGSIPGARAEIGEFASGLTLHLAAYSFIALLLFCGAQGCAWRKACKAFLIIAAMGAVDECVQSLFSYRGASVLDWFIDINAGLFTTAFLWSIWPKEEVGEKSTSLS